MVLFYKVPSALGAQSSAQDAQNPQKSAACWPGQSRKLITHSARNGFLYTMERANGAIMLAKPYSEVNGTKGIDQRTGKPLDHDPDRDIQTYADVGNLNPNEPLKKVCPSLLDGNNYWPSTYR
jgi:alcohol dehydrogenase (cytochrome c)